MKRTHLYAIAAAVLALAPAVAEAGRAETVATYFGSFGRHDISADGRSIVFERTQTDAGGNLEHVVTLWHDSLGATDLLTSPTLFLSNLHINADGSTVAAVINEDITGTGASTDEVYRWRATSGWQRITFSPDISATPSGLALSDDGRRIAFASNADITGQNPQRELQIHLWAEGAGIRQITPAAPCGANGANFLDDLSGDGRRVAFGSRCDFTGANPDLLTDLFLWDETDGIRQLTAGDQEVNVIATLDYEGKSAALNAVDLARAIPGHLPGSTPGTRLMWRWVDGHGFEPLSKQGVSSGTPQISSDGTRIAFIAHNGQGSPVNPEGSDEIFLWQLGEGVTAVTDSAQPDPTRGNIRPTLSGDGTRILLVAEAGFDTPTDSRRGRFLVDVLGTAPAHADLLTNGGFDGDLSGWNVGSGVSFDAADARDGVSSGSARLVATGTRGSGLSQCVSVAPATTHILSGQLRGLPGTDGQVVLQVDLYSGKGCTGTRLKRLQPVASQHNEGAFVGRFGRFPAPRGARSARLRVFATDDGSGAPFEATVDDIALRPDNPKPLLP